MKIILLADGSWEHEEDVYKLEQEYIILTIAENWSDREISQMINDYYKENLNSIFQ